MAAKKTANSTPSQRKALQKRGSSATSESDALGMEQRPRRAAAAEPDQSRRLDVGDRLPKATLEDQRGRSVQLDSLRGKPAIVYFYPRDDTPGCTREACAFQESLASLTRLGVAVVGISPDTTLRHGKFAEKYGLKFTLLSDADRDYARACGVLVPKTLYGRTSIGVERTTFFVDARGVVKQVWRKVKVDGHVDQVVALIRDVAR